MTKDLPQKRETTKEKTTGSLVQNTYSPKPSGRCDMQTGEEKCADEDSYNESARKIPTPKAGRFLRRTSKKSQNFTSNGGNVGEGNGRGTGRTVR